MLRYSTHRALEGAAGLRSIATPLLSLPEYWVGLQSRSAKLVHTFPPAYTADTMPGAGRQQAQSQQLAQHQKALQNDPALRRKVLVNSLLYRSRQRGFLEMDLLVGIWAEKQIPNLSEEMLVQFSEVLDQENPDLYKWLTGQEKPTAAMAGNAAYKVCSTFKVEVSWLHTPQTDPASAMSHAARCISMLSSLTLQLTQQMHCNLWLKPPCGWTKLFAHRVPY